MMWLEMTRTEEHGGPGWGLGECLWSPTHKNPKGKWGYWETLRQVRRDDVVLHLVGKTHRQAFTGYSIAAEDGQETKRRPPKAEEWGYADSFYRVRLRNYEPFVNAIKLDEIFAVQEIKLREYFRRNKARSKTDKERLFFVEQANRLQCLNGAYLSLVSDELANIILGSDFSMTGEERRPDAISVATGEQIRQIRSRLGQGDFSESVCNNYSCACCFPGCDVKEKGFLVGAHIARWADAPELRGETANGLCLCLMHDRAFESGLFTLTSDGRIWVNDGKARNSKWATENLVPYQYQPIKQGRIAPAVEALRKHWKRVRCIPEGAG